MRFVEIVLSGGGLSRVNPLCVGRVESVIRPASGRTRLCFPDGDTLYTDEEAAALVARLEQAMKPEPMVFG